MMHSCVKRLIPRAIYIENRIEEEEWKQGEELEGYKRN